MIENNKSNQQGVDDIKNNFIKSLSPEGIHIFNSICSQEKLINYKSFILNGVMVKNMILILFYFCQNY